MQRTKKTFAAIYSGGKDGHLAILNILKQGHKVSCLINIDGGAKHRKIFHDLRKTEILRSHAELMNIPIVICKAPENMTGGTDSLGETIKYICDKAAEKYNFDALCSGASDEDDKGNAEDFIKAGKRKGITVVTPIADYGVYKSIKYAQKEHVTAIIVGAENQKISPDFLGKKLDAEFTDYLKHLNESGTKADGNDFQTLVINSPLFSRPIKIVKAKTVKDKERFLYKITDFK